MRPLIGVTTTEHAGEYRTPQIMLGRSYVAALELAGATPVLLTPAHGPEALGHLLDLCHGLLLSGGEDVEPARYGQTPHPKLGIVNHARDEMELSAVSGAVQRQMPVLAICRGVQLLNVAFGGTLFQDLPSQRAQGVIHEQEAPLTHRWHGARVEEDSQLGRIFGATDLFINSFHHQGIDRLGEGLRPSVWAEDGLIEGVESTEHPWVMGVQWHPERGEAEILNDQRDPDRRLFWAFVEASRSFAGQGVGAGG